VGIKSAWSTKPPRSANVCSVRACCAKGLPHPSRKRLNLSVLSRPAARKVYPPSAQKANCMFCLGLLREGSDHPSRKRLTVCSVSAYCAGSNHPARKRLCVSVLSWPAARKVYPPSAQKAKCICLSRPAARKVLPPVAQKANCMFYPGLLRERSSHPPRKRLCVCSVRACCAKGLPTRRARG
jgi:hypothetical protein